MKKMYLLSLTLLGMVLSLGVKSAGDKMSGAPPFGDAENEAPRLGQGYWFENWTRPSGPAKVLLQAGHWLNEEAPEEQKRLRNNHGASAGGVDEVDINIEIAGMVASLLTNHGVEVEVLPTTIPPRIWADVFVSIHADGSEDNSVSGYKVAGPWRDYSGKSNQLTSMLDNKYGQMTGLRKDPNISRNMRGYYAFSWWKYEHAVHPMTASAIVETGFVTNKNDRDFLTQRPEVASRAIAEGILEYLKSVDLI